MTVEDLIEALMKQPLTAPVFIAGTEALYPVDSVDYERGIVMVRIDDLPEGADDED